jgi:hypothetical protein
VSVKTLICPTKEAFKKVRHSYVFADVYALQESREKQQKGYNLDISRYITRSGLGGDNMESVGYYRIWGMLDLIAFLVFLGVLVIIVSIVVLLVRTLISYRAGKKCGR